MKLNEYQRKAMVTANWKHSPLHQIIPPDVYCALKLNGESGELAEKVGKVYRDNDGLYDIDRLSAIELEIGDVLWYLAGLCDTLGLDLSQVAQKNLDKLENRSKEGKIHGDGDYR